MLDPDEKDKAGVPLTARAVFIMGPDKRLKLSILYPATTGRNFKEVAPLLIWHPQAATSFHPPCMPFAGGESPSFPQIWGSRVVPALDAVVALHGGCDRACHGASVE